MNNSIKKFKDLRKELFFKMKIINEQGDNRYPRPFLKGYILGLGRSINELDKTINTLQKEE